MARTVTRKMPCQATQACILGNLSGHTRMRRPECSSKTTRKVLQYAYGERLPVRVVEGLCSVLNVVVVRAETTLAEGLQLLQT